MCVFLSIQNKYVAHIVASSLGSCFSQRSGQDESFFFLNPSHQTNLVVFDGGPSFHRGKLRFADDRVSSCVFE